MRGKLCFDISAMVIMFVVLAYSIHRNTAKNNRNRQIFAIVCVAFISNIATITNSIMLICGHVNAYLFTLLDAVDNMALTLLAPCYVLYVVQFTGNGHKLFERKKMCYTLSAPAVFGVLFIMHYCFKSILTDTISIGSDLSGAQVKVGYCITIFYAVVCGVYLYYYKRVVEDFSNFILTIPIVLTVVSMTMHLFAPTFHSVFFTVSMCFLLLLLLTRSVSGVVDVETGFRTQTAFADDMYIAKCLNSEMKMILIKLINYNEAINRSGYEEVKKAIVQMSKTIVDIVDDNLIEGDGRFYDESGSFIITLPKKYNDNAELLAGDIKTHLLNDVSLGSVDFSLLINVCIVSFPDDAPDADTILLLLNDLENMGYSDKILSASDITSTEDFNIRKRMNIIIDRGLKNGNFSVYYQPIYDLKGEKFKSAEALIRLNDPEYGFISPGVFIPIAEKTGAIHAIGSFVLEEVIKFVTSDDFERLGLEYIEVNLSAAQCLRVDLTDEIKSLAEKYNLNPRRLNLEITETAECYSQDVLLGNIRSLHNMGYCFSLDDFGTGYSNLMRMASLPIDLVKLDRAFVLMDDNDRFHSIIKNMVRLFKEMGLSTLVEGVETIQMVEKFRDIDVDYIQGFYYSRPLPENDFIAFLRSQLG